MTAAGLLALLAACPGSSRTDSVAYEQQLAAWLRDSAVIDSIARTIDTDSLYRVHRSALTADNPEPVYQQIACEGDRLYIRHGTIAAELAIARMRDTLWKPGEEDEVRRMRARLPRVVELSTEHCQPYTGPKAPKRIGDTPLNTRAPRPMRPFPFWR